MRITSLLRSTALVVAFTASASSVAAADTCVLGASGGCRAAEPSRVRSFVAALVDGDGAAAEGPVSTAGSESTTDGTTAGGRALTEDGDERDGRSFGGVSMGSRSLALIFALGAGGAIALLQSSDDRGPAAPARAVGDAGGPAVGASHPVVPGAVRPPGGLHPPVIDVTHPPVWDAHVVPEPLTVTLLATGLAGIGGMGALRRRRVANR